MVSAGTLMVFAVVALALLWHRYVDSAKARAGGGLGGQGGGQPGGANARAREKRAACDL